MPGISTVFLDRDGVINVDSPDFIKSWAEFHFIPKSIEAIRRLTEAGIRVIVITNQSAVHRRMITLASLEEMHRNMCQAVEEAGGRIQDIFFCPHLPDEGCDCRKPAPGMILAACHRHGIDIAESVMVGDSAKDILTAKTAGCGLSVLVQTGNGKRAEQILRDQGRQPDHIAADLDQAVDWIIGYHP